MVHLSKIGLLFLLTFLSVRSSAQSDSIVIKDLTWDRSSPAGMTELFIPSANAQLAGFIYRANGSGKHPTLLLLHGFPGNERNLDLAQVVRAHGWNVIYFDYTGSWGSQGKFSFKNCVADVTNVVSFCNKYQDSLKIDTSNIVLFGHSMGAWTCLKSLAAIPQIKKGFALSTWDIAGDFKKVMNKEELLALSKKADIGGKYFVLNATVQELFMPVIGDRGFYDISNEASRLSNKKIIMLDEHNGNKRIADALLQSNKASFEYQVWDTDHPFTNKRVSLMKKLISFLDQ